MVCFECSGPSTVQHHVVPKSKGGTKTLPLCDECHAKAHDSRLSTLRTRRFSEDDIERMVLCYRAGLSSAKIAVKFHTSSNTVLKHLKKRGLEIRRGPVQKRDPLAKKDRHGGNSLISL